MEGAERQQRLDVARAAIREAYMLSLGSHQEHEVEAQREYLQVALRAIEGTTTRDDLGTVELPLQRGYGREGDDIARPDDFSGQFT